MIADYNPKQMAQSGADHRGVSAPTRVYSGVPLPNGKDAENYPVPASHDTAVHEADPNYRAEPSQPDGSAMPGSSTAFYPSSRM